MTLSEESHGHGPAQSLRARNRILTLGAVAALVAAIVFRRWISAEYMALRTIGLLSVGPKVAPTTVDGWFRLLQANPFVGLTLLNAFDFINYALVGLIFFGVFRAMKDSAMTAMTVSVVLVVSGISIYFVSNHCFALLSLSRRYASASSMDQRPILLAAARGLLATSDQATFGNGPYWAFSFVTVSGLVISRAMLQSHVFPKTTAWFGIVANVLGLGYSFSLPFSKVIAAVPVAASAPFLLVWYILIAMRLLRLRHVVYTETTAVLST